MPRRRGLYALSKSTTHDVLPSASSYASFEPNNNTVVDLNAAFCCDDDGPAVTPLRRVKPAMSNWEMSRYYETDDDNGNRENTKNVSFSLGKALPKVVRKSSMSSVLRELFRTPKKTKERVSRLSQSFCTPQASRASSHDPGKVRFRERSCQEPYAASTPKRFTVEERYTKRRDRDRERSRSRRFLRDSFVNSQEWTMGRNVIEIRLGVLGSLDSGKTALVHRYLTGAYTPEESPEGGRFKKEIHIDGQSYLLLIRDEGANFPERQFAQWADAVIFVFSLENRDSFEASIQCFKEMTKYRNCSEMPMLLVGAQDNISGSKPRKVEESEGRRMAQSMHRCGYYETCSTYGLNVERVFKEVCQKALQNRPRWLHSSSSSGPRSSTPAASTLQHQQPLVHLDYQPVYAVTNNNGKPYHHQRSISALPLHDQQQFQRRSTAAPPQQLFHRDQPPPPASARSSQAFVMPGRSSHHQPETPPHHANAAVTSRSTTAVNVHPSQMEQLQFLQNEQFDNQNMVMTNQASASTSHLPTPNGTPTTQRKNRRISNIFQRQSKDHHLNSEEKAAKMSAEVNMGAGRAIPIKQGQLYKRSSKTLNREWKKKYVCLYPDGRLLYHHNIKDYMDKNSVGKEVFLGLATVKVSGRPVPRNTQRASTCAIPSTSAPGKENLVTAYEFLDGPTANGNGNSTPGDGTSGGSDADLNAMGLATSTSSSVVPAPSQKDMKKKRGHRRLGSGHKHNEDEDDCEFEIVTSDQKHWEFSATSVEERDEWVAAIEEQIELSLQAQMSQKQQHNSSRQHGDRAEVHGIREIAGNDRCADCGSLKPDWASLNLGTLICIECSGIHRNLGSHVSKVRSLELDDWPMEYLRVMQAIGNERANRLWEHNAPRERKPASDATREQKELWIKSKYEQKRFLPAVPVDRTFGKQILEAVSQRDMDALLVVLPRCEDKDLNAVLSSRDRRTPLHLACSLGSVEFVQLLIWYNADIRVLDESGRSAMWYGQQGGSRECIDVLKHNGLEVNYGMPSSTGSSSSASPADQMIMGSHVRSERDFATDIRNQVPSAAGTGEIKLRRSTNAEQPAVPPHAPGFSERASKAFDYLPASVI